MNAEINADILRRASTYPDKAGQKAAKRELAKRLVKKFKAGSNKIAVDLDLDIFKA